MKKSVEVKEWQFAAILAIAVLVTAAGMYWGERQEAGVDFRKCPLCGQVSR